MVLLWVFIHFYPFALLPASPPLLPSPSPLSPSFNACYTAVTDAVFDSLKIYDTDGTPFNANDGGLVYYSIFFLVSLSLSFFFYLLLLRWYVFLILLLLILYLLLLFLTPNISYYQQQRSVQHSRRQYRYDTTKIYHISIDLLPDLVIFYSSISFLGNAFYLGCESDKCRIHDSVVERNFIHDTLLGGGTHGISLLLYLLLLSSYISFILNPLSYLSAAAFHPLLRQISFLISP